MKLNNLQQRVVSYNRMVKVFNKENMWNTKKQVAYATKDVDNHYQIVVAKDLIDSLSTNVRQDVKLAIMLHELGHIYYAHVNMPFAEVFTEIENICKEVGVDYKECMKTYGGVMNFLNICTDLEINTTILTYGNINLMNSVDIKPLVPEVYNMTMQSDFRSYFRPLIEKFRDSKKEDNQSENGQNGQNNSNSQSDENNDSSDSSDSQSDNSNSQSSENSSTDDFEGNQNESQNGSSNSAKQDIENMKKDLKQFNNDVAYDNAPDPFDDNMSEDVKDSIIDDSYTPNKPLNETVEDKENQETVEDVENENEKRENSKSSQGYGTSHSTSNLSTNGATPKTQIANFLKSIIRTDYSEFKNDCMRLYNRGIRRNNDGILYNSLKRSRNTQSKQKMCICIDCSGSMDTKTVIDAIASIKKACKNLSQESEVILWDTELCQRFKIDNIPSNVYSGGGTDLTKAIKYGAENKFDEFVLYSDMEDNLPKMANMVKKNPTMNVYSIVVDYRNSTELEHFLKTNKKFIKIN